MFLDCTTSSKGRQLTSVSMCVDPVIMVYNPFTETNPQIQDEPYREADKRMEGIPINWSISFGFKSLNVGKQAAWLRSAMSSL